MYKTNGFFFQNSQNSSCKNYLIIFKVLIEYYLIQVSIKNDTFSVKNGICKKL